MKSINLKRWPLIEILSMLGLGIFFTVPQNCNLQIANHETSKKSIITGQAFNCSEANRVNITNTVFDEGTDRAKLGQIFTAVGTCIYALELYGYNNTNVKQHPTQVSVSLFPVDVSSMLPVWSEKLLSVTIPYSQYAPSSHGQWVTIQGFMISGLTVNTKYAFTVEGVDCNEGGPDWGGLSAGCTYESHGNYYSGGSILNYDASTDTWSAWTGFNLNFLIEMGFDVFNVYQETGHDGFGLGEVFTSIGTCMHSIKLQTYANVEHKDPAQVTIALFEMDAQAGLPDTTRSIYGITVNLSQWLAPSYRQWVTFNFTVNGLIPGRQYALIFHGDVATSLVSACKSSKVNSNYLGGYMLLCSDAVNWVKMDQYDLDFQVGMNYEQPTSSNGPASSLAFIIIGICITGIFCGIAMYYLFKRYRLKKKFVRQLLEEKRKLLDSAKKL